VIGHYPPPNPDELLYSIHARHTIRFDFRSSKHIGQTVFGRATATAIVGLPIHLSALIHSLPTDWSITFDMLIDRHTLWPFFAAFQSPARRKATRSEMNCNGYPYQRLGLMASGIAWSESLRYCSACLQENRIAVGEAYWHRVHQLPGIEVCPHHKTFLIQSKFRLRNSRNRHAYHSADVIQTHPVDLIRKPSEAQILIAQAAAWILENPQSFKYGEELRQLYLGRCAEMGYATYSGRLHLSPLRNDFFNAYPCEWLGGIGCALPHTRSGWLERLLRKHRTSQHPVRHLLLMHFLDLGVADVLQSSEPFPPFGYPPWPCLNSGADHYGEASVILCTIRSSSNGRRVSGLFECPRCGMQYLRYGPDKQSSDRLFRNRIPRYGSVWDETLSGLWADSRISLRVLCRRLGVDPLTVRRQAQRLGLTAVRPGHRVATIVVASSGHDKSSLNTVQDCQLRWLKLRKRLPQASRSELRAASPGAYLFLHRHARNWLDVNLPASRIPIRREPRVNWFKRDQDISDAVKSAVGRLVSCQPPVRLTRTAILREAGYIWVLSGKLEILPNTREVLNRLVEDRTNFAIRRIDAICHERLRCGKSLPRWQLIRLAGLRPDMLVKPEVQYAFELALRWIAEGPYVNERANAAQGKG
jgi:hypothetical protein